MYLPPPPGVARVNTHLASEICQDNKKRVNIFYSELWLTTCVSVQGNGNRRLVRNRQTLFVRI